MTFLEIIRQMHIELGSDRSIISQYKWLMKKLDEMMASFRSNGADAYDVFLIVQVQQLALKKQGELMMMRT